jgi:hypothetical protein
MESRIEQLLTKYWAGETSLQEEEELKAFYKENPSLTPIGMYFRGLKKNAEIESPRVFKKPGGWFTKTQFSVAATVIIGIMVGTMILRDTGKKHDFEITDPQQAYEIAQTVLVKMSASLNEAQTHSTQLQKLNRAEEILKETQL